MRSIEYGSDLHSRSAHASLCVNRGCYISTNKYEERIGIQSFPAHICTDSRHVERRAILPNPGQAYHES